MITPTTSIRALRTLFAIALTTVWASASTVTLQDLLDGGSIVNGDKEFFGFHNASQNGDLNVPYDKIFVDPILGGPGVVEDEYGIRFSSAFWTLTGPNSGYDLSFDFHVRQAAGLPLITDNTLEFTGDFVGDGRASIAEGVMDHASGATLQHKLVFFDKNGSVLLDHQVFPGGPYVELEISKDFAMSTGPAANSRVFVSHFDQTFSQRVPDGGPGVFGALSLVGMLWAARNRRQQVR